MSDVAGATPSWRKSTYVGSLLVPRPWFHDFQVGRATDWFRRWVRRTSSESEFVGILDQNLDETQFGSLFETGGPKLHQQSLLVFIGAKRLPNDKQFGCCIRCNLRKLGNVLLGFLFVAER